MITCAKQVEALQNDFMSRMRSLKVTVHAKCAVPTSQVFVSSFRKCYIHIFDLICSQSDHLKSHPSASFHCLGQTVGGASGGGAPGEHAQERRTEPETVPVSAPGERSAGSEAPG